MTEIATLAASLGATPGAVPTDPEIGYDGVFSTPAEAGVDQQVTIALFSDNTYVDAKTIPTEPTNAGDPVAPQQGSQSSGAMAYPPGILHAYPDDQSIVPGGGIYPPPPPPVTVWTASAMTAASPSVATVADTTDLTVGTTVALSGDPLVNGQTAVVSAIAGTDVTLGIDLSGGAPAGPVTLTKV
jgi:hypothetical protein